MSTKRSNIQQIDNRTNFIIFGYCRQKIIKPYTLNIPSTIQYVIAIFYWIQEKLTLHGDYVKVDYQTNTIQGTDIMKIFGNMKYNTIYGNKIVNLNDEWIQEYQWTFKIISLASFEHDDEFPIIIGIDSSLDKCTNTDFSSTSFNGGLFYSIAGNGHSYNAYNFAEDVMRIWEQGDTIKFMLNPFKRQLKVQKNDDKVIVFHKHFDYAAKEYNIAIAMAPLTENIVQLIDFTAIHVSR